MSSSPESALDPEAPTLRTVVGRIVHAFEKQLTPGDVAALRRLDPDDPTAPAFFKVAASVLEGALPQGEEARLEAERRWAAILCAIALTNGFHHFGRPLGSALAAAGFPELRLTRLLRARGEQMFPTVRTAARFLASKAEPFDPVELAHIVLSEGRTDEEKVRRAVARSYFATLSKNT